MIQNEKPKNEHLDSNFKQDLIDYFNFCGLKDAENCFGEFDFSTSTADLIFSVPGKHLVENSTNSIKNYFASKVKDNAKKEEVTSKTIYGHLKLKQLLSQYQDKIIKMLANDLEMLNKFVCSGSLKSCNSYNYFLRYIYSVCVVF